MIFIFCFILLQSAREAEIKLKSESRVKLFYLDPDAQVRGILIFKIAQGKKSFDRLFACLLVCLFIYFGCKAI